jgi:membrane fusion protein
MSQDQEVSAEKAGVLVRQAHEPSRSILHDIFRKDALDGLRDGYGAPVKPVGVTATALTVFFVVLVGAVITFLLSARYARKETVAGQVTPTQGSFRIAAQISGTADRVLVREGQAVKAGEVLITVKADPVLHSGATLVDSLRTIQATQRRALEVQARARAEQLARQIEELAARRDGLVIDIARLDESTALLEKRRQLHAQTAEAHKQLAVSGMVSPAFIRQQEDGLLGVRQQIGHAQREAALQRSQLAQVQAQIGRLHAESDLLRAEAGSMSANLQERELNFEALHAGHLVAPIDGVVTALQVREGAAVSAGRTLAVIIAQAALASKDSLEVELWAPSKAVGFVQAGAKVRLMYDAFPYQTFGVGNGTVKEVSGTPLAPADLPTPSEGGEQLFRIRVTLAETALRGYGRDLPLVPGMRVTADLILEEQSLMEWVLGPLRAAHKRAI